MSPRAWTRSTPRWSQAELVRLLRQDSQNGTAPAIGSWRRSPDRPSVSTVDRLFGSWGAAVRAAGLEMRRQRKPKSTEQAEPEQPQPEAPRKPRRDPAREQRERDAELQRDRAGSELRTWQATDEDWRRLDRALARRRWASPTTPERSGT